MLTQVIKVLEYVNIGITVLFLGFYIYRLLSLRHFSVTDRYQNKYPMTRFILCAVYFVISLPFLALSIVDAVRNNNQGEFWILEEGVGEFVDAIILIIQCAVLKNQLSKQRPYTAIHIIFSLYLAGISIARFVVVIVDNTKFDTDNTITGAFYLAFMVNSFLILALWIVKRQELPQFQENRYFSFEEFRVTAENSRILMNRHIEISYLRKISDSFHYIHPVVSVEKGRFRIVLEIYQGPLKNTRDDTEMYDRNSRTLSSPVRTSQHRDPTRDLRVISTSTYTVGQIKELYKICGRFSIKQHIAFDCGNMAEVYKSLQSYLEELFADKKHYMSFVLNFFDVSEQILERYDRELRMTLKGSEMDMHAHLDSNAAIISIKLYKQMWIDDHYLFYMDVVALDGSFESRPMKRYTDFEALYGKLLAIIKRRYGKHALPELPKKYLFNWDESKITQRRVELESFIRNIANDYKLMLEMHELREVVLNFLLCQTAIKPEPLSQRAIDFCGDLEILKGDISKHLVANEYVTFYQFRLVKNGLPLRTIKKRYSDFEELHESLQRHMYNTQIYYKFVVLPEKHLYKSGPIRHQKLRAYISSVLTIPDAWKIYDLVAFLHLDSSIAEIDLSRINAEIQGPIDGSPNFIDDSRDSDQYRRKRLVDNSSVSSNQRMSALIDELGG